MKIFKGFQLDLVIELTELSRNEIATIRKNGIIAPSKTGEGFCYGFADLLLLKLIKRLKINGISIRHIERAAQYFKDITPDKRLIDYKLYIRTDSKEILYIGDDPSSSKYKISASNFGQLVMENLLCIIPVGEDLDRVSKRVVKLDSQIEKGIRAKKLIPLDVMLRKNGRASA